MSRLEDALTWHKAGCSVVRVKLDGTKAPEGLWTQYQEQRAAEDQLRAWWRNGCNWGVGVVCGQTSGNLEMFEFEGRAVAEGIVTEFRDIIAASGLADVWSRVVDGYLEHTPSGGIHLLYRVTGGPVAGNTKLAERPMNNEEREELFQQQLAAGKTPERAREIAKKGKVVYIETRGEGGYTVVAPTNGTAHPSGKPWVTIKGSPATIPTITADERDAIHAIARMLDKMPAGAEPENGTLKFTQPRHDRDDASLPPGTDYNERADWRDIIGAHGWDLVLTRGGASYWRRPGKDRGVSATTGRNDGDNLYVFSTSTEFDTEKPYSKFAAYALLEHGGDYSAAARALRAQGYGGTRPSSTASTAASSARERSQQHSSDPESQPAESRRVWLTPAASIKPRPVRWIWDTAAEDAPPSDREGRIPVGSLTLAAGRAGLGKSQFACWKAARITTGTLPGIYWGVPRAVIYAASEDSWEMTITPRLIAAGADLSRVYRIDVIDDEDPHAQLCLPRDIWLLERAIADHDVALIILDPLLSLIDHTINDYRAREVRQALEPLVAVADRTRVTLLGLAHFTKATGSDPLMLISGSAAFGQLVRAAIGFARDEDSGEELNVLSTIKNNLGRENLPSLVYAIRPAPVETAEGEAWVSRLEFTGQQADRSVRDLLRGAADAEERTERDEAADWLRSYLTDQGGEAAHQDVIKAARATGFSERTLTRARKKARVITVRCGFPSTSVWKFDTESEGQPPVRPQSDQSGHACGGGPTGLTGGRTGRGSDPPSLEKGDPESPPDAAENVTVLGSCVRCFAPTQRFGPTGNPLCVRCRESSSA